MEKKLAVIVVLAMVSIPSLAATFVLPYEYGGQYGAFVQVDLLSTNTFEVGGSIPAGYHVEWYVTEYGGWPVEEDTIPEVGIPEINPASFTRDFPNPGTDWVRAEVYDTAGQLVDLLRWQVDVLAPDLVVEDIWTEPEPVIQGENYRIFARIRNIGDVMASVVSGSQFARFHVDGFTVDTIPYDDVAPGASVVVQTGILPGSYPAGSHSVRVEADCYDGVDEEGEGNNSRTESMVVVAPDLTVESIGINPGYAWRPTTITAVIRNIGDATAEFGAFDRICHFEVDGQVKYETLVSPRSIPPGGTCFAEATFTVSTLGNLSVTALADPDNEIVEESEGNNSRTESEAWTASTIHDTDGDGMIDADEVVAGSEPDNGSNVWKCATVPTNSGFIIIWPSLSNRWYAVERTCNLTNDFVVIASNLPATPPENSWLDSTTSNAFYRVEVKQ